MHMRPTGLRCGRCRTALPDRSMTGRQVRFDERTHELCPECWRALEGWLAQGDRVRDSSGAAA